MQELVLTAAVMRSKGSLSDLGVGLLLRENKGIARVSGLQKYPSGETRSN